MRNGILTLESWIRKIYILMLRNTRQSLCLQRQITNPHNLFPEFQIRQLDLLKKKYQKLSEIYWESQRLHIVTGRYYMPQIELDTPEKKFRKALNLAKEKGARISRNEFKIENGKIITCTADWAIKHYLNVRELAPYLGVDYWWLVSFNRGWLWSHRPKYHWSQGTDKIFLSAEKLGFSLAQEYITEYNL